MISTLNYYLPQKAISRLTKALWTALLMENQKAVQKTGKMREITNG